MSSDTAEPPFLQRAYDNVWLLGLVALVFFTVMYVVWGLVDLLSIPVG